MHAHKDTEKNGDAEFDLFVDLYLIIRVTRDKKEEEDDEVCATAGVDDDEAKSTAGVDEGSGY